VADKVLSMTHRLDGRDLKLNRADPEKPDRRDDAVYVLKRRFLYNPVHNHIEHWKENSCSSSATLLWFVAICAVWPAKRRRVLPRATRTRGFAAQEAFDAWRIDACLIYHRLIDWLKRCDEDSID
jgi:hypothetical protein